MTFWRYRRPFRIMGHKGLVTLRSRSTGLTSALQIDGQTLASDSTPLYGLEALRNHCLEAQLSDGSTLTVTAGWISALNTGVAVRVDGVLVHESHPGKNIAYPEKYREAALTMGSGTLANAVHDGWHEGLKAKQEENYDPAVWQRNRIPLGVDITLGLVFFAIAKLTDLTTAALAGAAIGIALLVVQRLTKIDLLGGLALFGIAMMLISAALALVFQNDEAVKYRSTIMGLIGASLFFADGLAGGKRLAKRLMRYLPYTDIDPVRLGLGMGAMGLVMAAANQAIAMLASTDIWLYYTTFGDFVLTMGLILLVFRYARGQMLRTASPPYQTAQARWPDDYG